MQLIYSNIMSTNYFSLLVPTYSGLEGEFDLYNTMRFSEISFRTARHALNVRVQRLHNLAAYRMSTSHRVMAA